MTPSPRRRRLSVLLAAAFLTSTFAPPARAIGSDETGAVQGTLNPDQPRVVERTPIEFQMPPDGGASRGSGADSRDPSINLQPEIAAGPRPPTSRTELTGQRTEHGTLWANPDGTVTLDTSPARIRYRDSAGAWQSIDLSLVPSVVDGYDLAVKANDGVIRIGTRDAETALAQVGGDLGSVGLRALDFPSTLAAATEPTPTPTPTASPTPPPTQTPIPSSSDPASPEPSPSPTSTPVATPTPGPSAGPSVAPAPSAAPSDLAVGAASAEPSPGAAPAAPPSEAPSAAAEGSPPPAGTPVPSALPTPVPSPEPSLAPVAGATTTSSEQVFEKDASTGRIAVSPADTGVEFRIVLTSQDQAATYSFALAIGDLDPTIAPDGSITLSRLEHGEGDVTRTPAGLIGGPVLFDAGETGAPVGAVATSLYRPGVDAVPPPGLSPEALASLRPGEVVVTYGIDPTWLGAPERRFPVTLDPTICMRVGDGACDSGGYVEHYLEQGLPDTYAVPSTWLRVGYSDAPDSFQNMRSLLWFHDVALPDGAHVTGASLTLQEDDNRDGTTSPDIFARLVNKGWGTHSTWNQMADAVNTGYDSPTVHACSTGATDCAVTLDVRKVVRAWYTRRGQDWKPNIGFQVRYATESSTEKETRFYLATNATVSNRPKLSITYETPGVQLDFAPELGASYSPATMVAGLATTLPIKLTNSGSVTWNTVPSGGLSYRVGYRWTDAKGNVVASGTQALPAAVSAGANTGVFSLNVTPPATPGQYGLRLDLVHDDSGVPIWTSDWAKPTLFYARNKKVLTADATRWTGKSVIERADFSLNVIRGGGTNAGEQRSVELGDGSSVSLDLYSRNVHLDGAGGLSFDDLLAMGVSYGYDSKHALDCATQESPTLRDGTHSACGWYTDWDERLTAGATPGAFTYQGPSGNRYFVDTDGAGQLVSNAPVLLERLRYSIFDEHVLPATAGTIATAASQGIPSWAGSYVLVAPSNASKDVGTFGTVDLAAYSRLRFAARTSNAVSAGIRLKVHNASNPGDYADRYFVLTLGTDWTTGYYQLALGGSPLVGNWRYYDTDLYAAIKATGVFGKPTDALQVTQLDIWSSSGANSGSTFVDGVRFEAIQDAIIADAVPSFTSNSSNAVLSADIPTLPVANTYAVKVWPSTLGSAPVCVSPCLSASSGDLFARPFVSWWWRKSGGTAVAIEFNLKDLRTSATGKITYYAGPIAPPGAVNPIQVSDEVPTLWAQVNRNVLDDGRQILNFYQDGPTTSDPGAPPDQGPTPDDVKWIGYTLWAVDGTFAVFDHLRNTSVPNVGEAGAGHPSFAGDPTLTPDFSATYADGSVHAFDADGLLERITDRDGNRINLDWSINATKTLQSAYTLITIHAPMDATTSGYGTYDRDLTYTAGSGTVTFGERLGLVSATTGRTLTFSFDANNDLTALKPARTPTCAMSDPTGCLAFTYIDTTNHRLSGIRDLRYTAANDNRIIIGWTGSDPVSIRDAAPAGDPTLLRVLNYAATPASPASVRVLWQDAAAIRAGYATYTDLSADGSVLTDYIPLACGGAPVDCAANPPPTGSLSSSKRSATEFDGLARANKAIAYITPSGAQVVTRQGTKAGARVDNYIDPLTSGQVAWTQSADQYLTSMRLSAGTQPDLYRTAHTYDEDGNETAVADPAWNARPDFSGTTVGTVSNPANLRGYWRLGETSGSSALDSSQYNNVGTYANGVVLNRAGALINDGDRAAGFDGTNDVVTLPDIGTISGSFTVSAWAKADTAGTLAVLGTRDAADFGFVLKLVGGTTLRAEIGTGSAWLTQTADVPFAYQTGRWYHLAYVVSPTGWTAFIDGAPVARGVLSGTPLFSNSTHKLRIGSNGRTTVVEPFDGDIDEVAVWGQALTSPQVRMLYLAGRSMAIDTARSLYDDEAHPIQTDDQFLASPGFESATAEWDLAGAGQLYLATSPTDPLVHQPADPEAPHSWASFFTGTDGSARQDVALVPGQTFRFQVWTSRPAGSGNSSIAVWYWKRSTNAWTNIVTSTPGPIAWTGYAWDLTLPLDADGRVRVTLSESGASTGVYFDDAAIVTSLARTTYWTNGLAQSTYTFSPDPASGIPEITAKPAYAATAAHPAIFPTSLTMNWVDGSYDPAAPDTDVISTTAFDPWGRPLLTTDPDGVDTETSYVSSGNGFQTDVAWTEDGLDNRTTYAYDLDGNQVTVDPPVVGATTMTYDQLGRVLRTTPPSPGTPTQNEYDGTGFLTRTIANYVDGNGSGAGAIDDVATAYTYDAFGRTTSVIGNDGSGLGIRTKRSVETFDLLGNPTSSSVWSTDTGSFGGQRSTSAYHEIWSGLARPAIAGSRGPGSLVPGGAPAPLCPDGGGLYCNAVTGFDLDGQPLTVTDAYGKIARTFRDLAGRPVFGVANYVDGIYDPAAPDTDLLTITRYDMLGRADETVDVLGRSTLLGFDGVGRTIQATASDNTNPTPVAVSKTKTVYTAGGRVDRASAPGAVADADSALAWTKSVYDGAGRKTLTFAHWDPTGSAPMELDSFEAPETDLTLANDGIAEAWATTGTFLTAGADKTLIAAAASAESGAGRLDVGTHGTANTGVVWSLDGTYLGFGSIYKARVWVNPPSGMTVGAKLGNATQSAVGTTVAGDGSWHPLDVTWNPAADQSAVRLAVYQTTATSGMFSVDDAIVWDSLHVDAGIPSETAYDGGGRVVASILPPGDPAATAAEQPLVTRTAYDDLNRVTAVTTSEVAGGGGGSEVNLDTHTAYDALGRPSSTTDPTGTLTTYTYDRLGRLAGTVLNYVDGIPTDGTTVDDDVASSFAYDAASELVGYCPAVQLGNLGSPCDVTSASENRAWHYVFDDAGHQAKQAPPVNAAGRELANRFWTYDPGGRLTKVCDDIAATCTSPGTTSKSRFSVPTYDGAGRVTRLDTSQGWGTAPLALRTDTTYLGDGQVKQSKAYSGPLPTPTLLDTLDATYDTLGRPDQLKRSATVLADFAWNPDGTLLSRLDGSDTGTIGTTSFTYDWADRLTGATLPAGWTTTNPSFTWRADGLIKSRTWNGGSAAAFSYDRAKRLTGIAKGTLSFGQTYDRDGNVTSESRTLGFSGDAGAGTQTFAYDALNRVLSSTGLGAGHNLTYRYDLDGNRTSKSDGTTTWTYGYDQTDQLASLNGGPTTFGSDAFGNLTAKWEDDGTQTNYAYDLADKLTTIDRTGTANDATFTFDALGRAWTRVLAGSTDTYAYGGPTETVSRIHNSAGSGTDTDSIVDALGDRLGVKVGSAVNWFLPDPHGNIAASLSADEATVVNATRYDPYGEVLLTGSGGGSPVGADRWKYQGRLDVSPAGVDPLYDMSARFYAPSTGTFTSLDSVAGSAQNPLSMNRFLYAEANPATLIDPSGHCIRWQDDYCADHKNGTNAIQKVHAKKVHSDQIRRRTTNNRRSEYDAEHRTNRNRGKTNGEVAKIKEEARVAEVAAQSDARESGHIAGASAASQQYARAHAPTCQGICIDPLSAVAGLAVAGGIAACVILCAGAALVAATGAATGAGLGAVVGAGSYAVGTLVVNAASNKQDLWEGFDWGDAAKAAVNGAVVGGVAGGTFGLGTAAVGTSFAATRAETWALGALAGPTASLAGILFKAATNQPIGWSDGAGAIANMVPLPSAPKLQVGLGIALDQFVNAIGSLLP